MPFIFDHDLPKTSTGKIQTLESRKRAGSAAVIDG